MFYLCIGFQIVFVSLVLRTGLYIYTVSGQNKIGREFTLLALIQPTVIKQQAVNNNWL